MKIQKLLVLLTMFIGVNIFAGFAQEGNYVTFTDRLSLRVVQNQTMNSSFKLFYAGSDCLGYIFPKDVLTLQPSELFMQQDEKICLWCVKGSFLPIYIKDEGRCSGQAPLGYHGPYYMSMWLDQPDVSDEQKIHVRYIVEFNKRGEIGIRIDPTGNCQILALNNMKLLPTVDNSAPSLVYSPANASAVVAG